MFGIFNRKQKRAEAMVKAASKGDIDTVREYLKKGVDVNVVLSSTALCNAASNGHVECVRFLLEQGAKVDKRNSYGCTALMCAADEGFVDVIDVLLEAGADAQLRGKGTNASSPSRNAYEWAELKGKTKAKQRLEKAGHAPKPAVEPVQDAQDADEVIFQRVVAGRLLQDVFNFKTFERISLIRKDEDSPVEAMTCMGFSALEDQSQLREAFQEHVKRGGTAEESRIFGKMLFKPSVKDKP